MDIKDFTQYLGTDKEVEFRPCDEWVAGKVVGIDLEHEHIKIERNNRTHWQYLKFQLTPNIPVVYKVRHKIESNKIE